ncbi:MAG: hypothetical protein U1C57_02160 [Candidatus Doudnabacteria bacterium]|nr:hypothetical protein [bacterium]MDZ4243885.1 hypothetical protein [Candidatus Doudnabacteria bacterium]
MKIKNYKIDNCSQEGVTLIIALIMLAAVTFISFSLSAVILREITAARLVLKTEPAISAANAGGEVGLYKLMRNLGQTGSTGQTPQSGASYQVVPDLYDDPYVFSVVAGAVLKVGLYNPENMSAKDADYGRVAVTNNASGSSPFKVTIYSWSDSDDPIASCNGVNVAAGSSFNCSLNKPDDRYIVEIETLGQDVAGNLRAFDDAGNPKGVPANAPSLEVTGRNLDVQRKIEINLQNQ